MEMLLVTVPRLLINKKENLQTDIRKVSKKSNFIQKLHKLVMKATMSYMKICSDFLN